MSAPAQRRIGPLLRFVLDLGPLLIFFAAYQIAQMHDPQAVQSHRALFAATGAFMVSVLVALGVAYVVERKLSPIPLFTAVLVIIFGGLTLWLKNDTFIKMKPTVLYAFFGFTLLVGLYFGHLFIKYVFAAAFQLTETGWRKLTYRWGIFFLMLACANELIWRSFSEESWVKFKVFAIIPLIMLFALAQMPLVLKHELKENSES